MVGSARSRRHCDSGRASQARIQPNPERAGAVGEKVLKELKVLKVAGVPGVMRVLLVGLMLCMAAGARGDGGMFVSESQWKLLREKGAITEVEQKAAIFYSEGTEKLVISPAYKGEASDFAWVVPVPARPTVSIVKGALFHELAELAIKRPKGRAKSDALVSTGVTVLERKTVGAYDVAVLKATQGKGLLGWLKTNGYRVPNSALPVISYYVRSDWHFAACRIKTPSNSKGLATGTLAPLQLTFKTKQPIYPMRMSAVNLSEFDVLVYLVIPRKGPFASAPASVKQVDPLGSPAGKLMPQASAVSGDTKKRPTLSRFVTRKSDVYVRRLRLRPQECTQDLKWEVR